jgi:exonuclease SbcD
MRILHTADWHLGQTFHEFDRTYEHQHFLDWLTDCINEKEIDVLLMSGDVFDGANPSTIAVNMFYRFLARLSASHPQLQMVITAGNHDSPGRLEAPNPFFEFYNIHIIGQVGRHADGSINYDRMLIPLKNRDGMVEAWCMAVPYIRLGEHPVVPDATSPYAEGVAALYKEAFEHACTKRQPGEAILAMGHLHSLNAELSDNDKTERHIMGGVEFVPVSAFSEAIAYTALGHIHKAQKIGGRENVRYSGSPIPMSFSEQQYKHQVIVFELKGAETTAIETVEIPISIRLLRVPATPKKLDDVLKELQLLPEADDDIAHAPYLEVRVLLDGPEPSLRYKIETALANKQVRFTKIDVNYPSGNNPNAAEMLTYDALQELKPLTVFNKIYQAKFDRLPPDELVQLFNEVTNEINQQEN